MYLVQRCNKTIAVTADLESAMAIFRVYRHPYTWMQVIDTTSDKVVAYWIY